MLKKDLSRFDPDLSTKTKEGENYLSSYQIEEVSEMTCFDARGTEVKSGTNSLLVSYRGVGGTVACESALRCAGTLVVGSCPAIGAPA
ncbi:hypothetical protein PoB_002831200 [Plakobranchus ocellatus]|uniref:Uncharacterized protein n=1 Tax=Plakobranchus ocellatus TaxID=259542 RepID=A0AAV4A398_9GAST|nr:hypothetical protein PoB_002831200 [Plakobranchus ocellatus]